MEKLTNAEVGAAIKARRLQLGLSELAFVTTAGIDAKTLQRLEDGTRWPWESTRLKIEQALKWSPGDIDKLRSGGEPTPLPDAESQPSSDIPSAARPSIFEESAIAGFPDVFRGLPRPEQLQVIDFTGQLQAKREASAVSSSAPSAGVTPHAAADAGSASSAGAVVEVESGGTVTPLPRRDQDEDALDDALKAHEERQQDTAARPTDPEAGKGRAEQGSAGGDEDQTLGATPDVEDESQDQDE